MDNTLIAYVDGSYNVAKGIYGYGCVLLLPEDEEAYEKISGSGNDTEVAKLRNVAGEMLGAMNAVKYAGQKGYKKLTIYYDYMGIEMWATGGWKCKNEYTMGYRDYMKKMSSLVDVSFEKVAAHTGDRFNELADKLAKEAVGN